MSDFNGPSTPEKKIRSMLPREAVAFELLSINYGSTDKSGKSLDRYAQCDNRVRVLHQDNRRLTSSRIKSCKLARGRLISRQDAGELEEGRGRHCQSADRRFDEARRIGLNVAKLPELLMAITAKIQPTLSNGINSA